MKGCGRARLENCRGRPNPKRHTSSFHANLSGMLPGLPRALNSDFPADSAPEISQSGVSGDAPADTRVETRIEHHCQICPTCSHRLTGHHCKLVCTHSGYNLSCADYY